MVTEMKNSYLRMFQEKMLDYLNPVNFRKKNGLHEIDEQGRLVHLATRKYTISTFPVPLLAIRRKEKKKLPLSNNPYFIVTKVWAIRVLGQDGQEYSLRGMVLGSADWQDYYYTTT